MLPPVTYHQAKTTAVLWAWHSLDGLLFPIRWFHPPAHCKYFDSKLHTHIFNNPNYITYQGFGDYICLAYPQKRSRRSASGVSFISPIFALWALVSIPYLVIKLGLPQNQMWKGLTVLTVDTGSFSTQWLVYCLVAAESALHSHLRLSFFITDCLLWDIKWLLPCAAPFLLA